MNQFQSATQSQRIYSFSIDFLIIMAMQLVLGSATLWCYETACHGYGVPSSPDVQQFISQFCGAFFFLGYFTLSVGLFGNTAGKFFMGIRVLKENTQRPLTLPEAYWRAMAYLMSSWTYMVGFILPWFREDKKALHDLLCGTRVVQRALSAELTGHQPEHHPTANVHWIRTLPTQEDLAKVRTGTDL